MPPPEFLELDRFSVGENRRFAGATQLLHAARR